MNSEFIPESIKNNINFNWNNLERIEKLNNMFSELNKSDGIKQTNDYKKLINEINSRIDAEYKAKQSELIRLEKETELNRAKKELAYLQSKNLQS